MNKKNEPLKMTYMRALESYKKQDYKNAGIKIIYNTPDDIFSAFQEMEKFIENKLEFDSLDIKLSKNFWKLFPEEAINTKEVIISPSFLKNNQNLFG